MKQLIAALFGLLVVGCQPQTQKAKDLKFH